MREGGGHGTQEEGEKEESVLYLPSGESFLQLLVRHYDTTVWVAPQVPAFWDQLFGGKLHVLLPVTCIAEARRQN